MIGSHGSALLAPPFTDATLTDPPWRPAADPSSVSWADDGGSLLAHAFDGLGQGLLICEQGGGRHGNAVYHDLVGSGPDGARLRAAMERLGYRLLGAPERAPGGRGSRVAELRGQRHRYQLRGARMPATHSREEVVLITAVRWPVAPPGPDVLRGRFGLTRRQAAVAKLLAERRTNKEIARQLSISPHTAKRHTEQVLLKLGVSSRRSVGELLRTLERQRAREPRLATG